MIETVATVATGLYVLILVGQSLWSVIEFYRSKLTVGANGGKQNRSYSSGLDLSSHFALACFLSLCLYAIHTNALDFEIKASAALLVLTACLLSFVLGLSVGKSWGRATRIDERASRSASASGVTRTKSSSEELIAKPSSAGETALSAPAVAVTSTGGTGGAVAVMKADNIADLNPNSLFFIEGFTIDKAFVEEACSMLQSIAGVTQSNPVYKGLNWKLMTTASGSASMWLSNEIKGAILLKGSAVVHSSQVDVLKWLLDQNVTSGLEDVMTSCELLHEDMKKHIIVKRFICKSDRLMFSSRSFVVVTHWTATSSGAIAVVTRSLPVSVAASSEKKGAVRGSVHSCGFLIQPAARQLARDGNTSEVFYGAHVSFGGSGGGSKGKADVIARAVSNTMNSLSLGAANSTVTENEAYGKKDSLSLSNDQRQAVLGVSLEALNRLEQAHKSAIASSNAKINGPSEDAALWNDIYNQDGIVCSEQPDATKTIGLLRATCTIDAPPNIIRRMLTEQPELIDSLVEERVVVSQLNARTSVQWLAYGAVWPVGAFDFLVVTVEEPRLDADGSEGFVIVSTSVDGYCENAFAHVGVSRDGENDEDDNMSTGSMDSETSGKHKYSRSCVRMAGYVGKANSKGGTVLSLYLDVDVYALVPGWLMQLLAQHGLSEMMGRIREASTALARGVQPQFSGSSTLGNMLHQIHSREQKRQELTFSVDSNSSTENKFRTISHAGDATEKDSSSKRPASEAQSPFSDETLRVSDTPRVASGGIDKILESMNYPNVSKNRFLTYAGKMQGEPNLEWILRLTKSGISIYSSPVANSTWQALRATIMIESDVKTLVSLLTNDSRIDEYDDMFDSYELIHKISDRAAVRRMKFKAIWPTSPRDFVVCTSWADLGGGTVLITTTSVSDDIYPAQHGFVRGSVIISGYLIVPIPEEQGGGVNMTMCVHTDLGGTLPVGIINMLGTSAPVKLLTTISQIARQESSLSNFQL